MLKQRFVVLFKPLAIGFGKVFGAILAYQLFGMAREYLEYLPLTFLDLLVGAGAVLLTIALFCALRACGEWAWFELRQARQFVGRLRRCSRDYRVPEAVRTRKA